MMKLSLMRDVFNTVNSDWECQLASDLVKYWNHDGNEIKMKRASSNFICKFKNDEMNCITRFNHDSERSYETIESEIQLLKYLESKGVRIAHPISSRNNKYIEQTNTEYGLFYSSVFNQIMGKQYEIDNLDHNGFYAWGKALGELHSVFKDIPKDVEINRKSHEHFLEEMIDVKFSIDDVEKNEVDQLRTWLRGLEKNPNNYGLIHYDFELDNIIWANDELYLIDFDDSIYSWFVADIANALGDLFDDGKNLNINDERYREFMKGYREEKEISEDELNELPHFYRLHHYLTYKKLRRSVDLGISDDNPVWMNNLIEKLTKVMNSYYEGFKSI
jgi:Ser/Thr protein kinase RdoA (MazF antagonist)